MLGSRRSSGATAADNLICSRCISATAEKNNVVYKSSRHSELSGGELEGEVQVRGMAIKRCERRGTEMQLSSTCTSLIVGVFKFDLHPSVLRRPQSKKGANGMESVLWHLASSRYPQEGSGCVYGAVSSTHWWMSFFLFIFWCFWRGMILLVSVWVMACGNWRGCVVHRVLRACYVLFASMEVANQYLLCITAPRGPDSFFKSEVSTSCIRRPHRY